MPQEPKYQITREWLKKKGIDNYDQLRKAIPHGQRITINKDVLADLQKNNATPVDTLYSYEEDNLRSDVVDNAKKAQAPKSIDTKAIRKWQSDNRDLLYTPLPDATLVKIPEPEKKPDPVKVALLDQEQKIKQKSQEAYQKNQQKLLNEQEYKKQKKYEDAPTVDQMTTGEYIGKIAANTAIEATEAGIGSVVTTGAVLGMPAVNPGKSISALQVFADGVAGVFDNAINWGMAIASTPWGRHKRLAQHIEDISETQAKYAKKGKYATALLEKTGIAPDAIDRAVFYDAATKVKQVPGLKQVFEELEDSKFVAKAPEGYDEAGVADRLTKHLKHTFFEMGPQTVSMSVGMALGSGVTKAVMGRIGKKMGQAAWAVDDAVKSNFFKDIMDDPLKSASKLTLYEKAGEAYGKALGYYGGMHGAAIFESGMEADESYTKAKQERFMAEYELAIQNGLTEDQAEKLAFERATAQAQIVRDNVIGANVALLTASNLVSGNLLKLNKNLTTQGNIAKEIYKNKAEAVGAYMKNLTMEGAKEGFFEEVSQTGISKYALDNAESLYAKDMASSMVRGILKGWEGLAKGDTETWMSGIFGLAGSAISTPLITTASNLQAGIRPDNDKWGIYLKNRMWNKEEVLKKHGLSKDVLLKAFDGNAGIKYENGQFVLDDSAVGAVQQNLMRAIMRNMKYRKGVASGKYSLSHLVLNEQLGELVYDSLQKGAPEEVVTKQILQFVKDEGIDSLLYQDVMGREKVKEGSTPYLAQVERSIEAMVTSYKITKEIMDGRSVHPDKQERIMLFNTIVGIKETEGLIKELEGYSEKYKHSTDPDAKTKLSKIESHLADLKSYQADLNKTIKKEHNIKEEADLKEEEKIKSNEKKIIVEDIADTLFNNHLKDNGDVSRIFDDPAVAKALEDNKEQAGVLVDALKKRVADYDQDKIKGREAAYMKLLDAAFKANKEDPFQEAADQAASMQYSEEEIEEYENTAMQELLKNGGKYNTVDDIVTAHGKDPRVLKTHLRGITKAMRRFIRSGGTNINMRLDQAEVSKLQEESEKGTSIDKLGIPSVVKQFLLNSAIIPQLKTSQDVIDVLVRTDVLSPGERSILFKGFHLLGDLSWVSVGAITEEQKVVPGYHQTMQALTIDLHAIQASAEDETLNSAPIIAARRVHARQDWEGVNQAEHEAGQAFLNTYGWTGDEPIYIELDMRTPWNRNLQNGPRYSDGFLTDGFNLQYVVYADRTGKVISYDDYRKNPNQGIRYVIGRPYRDNTDGSAVQKQLRALEQELVEQFRNIAKGLMGRDFENDKEMFRYYLEHYTGPAILPQAGQVFYMQTINQGIFNLINSDNMDNIPYMSELQWMNPAEMQYTVKMPYDSKIPNDLDGTVMSGRFTQVGPDGEPVIGIGDVVVWVPTVNAMDMKTYYPLKIFVPMADDVPGVTEAVTHILKQYLRQVPKKMSKKHPLNPRIDIGMPVQDSGEGAARSNSLTTLFVRTSKLGETTTVYPSVHVNTATNKLEISAVVPKAGSEYSTVHKFTYDLISPEMENAPGGAKLLQDTVDRILADIHYKERRLHISQEMLDDPNFVKSMVGASARKGWNQKGYFKANIDTTRAFRNTRFSVSPVQTDTAGNVLAQQNRKFEVTVVSSPVSVQVPESLVAEAVAVDKLNYLRDLNDEYQEELVKSVESHIQALMQAGKLEKINCK